MRHEYELATLLDKPIYHKNDADEAEKAHN